MTKPADPLAEEIRLRANVTLLAAFIAACCAVTLLAVAIWGLETWVAYASAAVWSLSTIVLTATYFRTRHHATLMENTDEH